MANTTSKTKKVSDKKVIERPHKEIKAKPPVVKEVNVKIVKTAVSKEKQQKENGMDMTNNSSNMIEPVYYVEPIVVECDDNNEIKLSVANMEKRKGIKLPIDQSDMKLQISNLVSKAPDTITSVINNEALKDQVYSITFNGKAVSPEQLFRRNNGSLISNLKGEHGLGKQTEINPVNNTAIHGANVANLAFSAASVATSTYYLKCINDNLSVLQNTVTNIEEMLKADKESKMKTDYKVIYDIASEVRAGNLSEQRRQYFSTQISNIELRANDNVMNYHDECCRLLNAFKNGKNLKEKKEAHNHMKRSFRNYRLAIQEYGMMELLKMQLLDEGSVGTLDNINRNMIGMRSEYQTLCDNAETTIKRHIKNDKSSNPKLAFGAILDIVGETQEKTIMKREGRKLRKVSDDIYANYRKKNTFLVNSILPEGCRTIADPFVEAVKVAKQLKTEPIEILVDPNSEDAYIFIDEALMED